MINERLLIDENTVVTAARSWIGTPYHHQASLKGVGCDCLGLVRGVWRELCGADPFVGTYSPSWGNVSDDARLLAAARQYLQPIDVLHRGSVVVLFVRHARSPKHCAIISGEDAMIHAYSGASVVESTLGYWRNQIAGIFALPDVGSARKTAEVAVWQQ